MSRYEVVIPPLRDWPIRLVTAYSRPTGARLFRRVMRYAIGRRKLAELIGDVRA